MSFESHRCNEEVGLTVRTAAFRQLQHAYQALPPHRIKDHILKDFGGNAVHSQSI